MTIRHCHNSKQSMKQSKYCFLLGLWDWDCRRWVVDGGWSIQPWTREKSNCVPSFRDYCSIERMRRSSAFLRFSDQQRRGEKLCHHQFFGSASWLKKFSSEAYINKLLSPSFFIEARSSSEEDETDEPYIYLTHSHCFYLLLENMLSVN